MSEPRQVEYRGPFDTSVWRRASLGDNDWDNGIWMLLNFSGAGDLTVQFQGRPWAYRLVPNQPTPQELVGDVSVKVLTDAGYRIVKS